MQPQFWGMILPSRQCGTSGWQALNVPILLLPSPRLLNNPLTTCKPLYVLPSALVWLQRSQAHWTFSTYGFKLVAFFSLMCRAKLYLLCHALVTEVLVWWERLWVRTAYLTACYDFEKVPGMGMMWSRGILCSGLRSVFIILSVSPSDTFLNVSTL